MKITLPIYLEERREDGRAAHYARAVFFHKFVEKHEMASRAVAKLAQKLQTAMSALAREGRHEQLAAYSFYPDDLDEKTLKMSLNLGDRHAPVSYLVFTFAAFGRRVAFTPTLPDVWWEIGRGELPALRAQEVYEQHFRAIERKHGKGAANPGDFSVNAKAWLSSLDVNVDAPEMFVKPLKEKFAFFGGDGGTKSGSAELQSVGRCLDWLYPDELDRPVGRDAEADELFQLLKTKDRRPVLILGPRGAGKTAVLHEIVRRFVAARRSAHSGQEQFWLLAPQRLVAGMSYVGEWEARLLAIVKHAQEQRHILYFDDLLGLYQAGISAQSSLSMAHVLKPYIERRDVRIVAEMTPEALRVLQEKDRGLADQFHVLRVNEMDENQTLRALVGVMRDLEQKHECRFQTDALPAVMDLQRRYARESVFPGKAAGFLRRVALKRRKDWVTRFAVLAEFKAQSGFTMQFLDDGATLKRGDVLQKLREKVVGQENALNAAADVVTLAKARLNDTSRPLASMLFLGPTGVGKTYCAKTLAEYLFGAAERLLRFDMNEFVSPYAVARLVGTFDQPEGLLTGAMRRQPFAVVLLDEIEKAHPDVFNLLLQVMDDGRLTDALGRTADFSNAIIILTSNLGVREAGAKLGFRHSQTREGHVFTQAAEKFFKPEFFNRLDRIVPFERLRREDVGDIARHLLNELWQREGLARRRCKLLVDDETLDAVVEAGYHPLLGARALKRAVERHLTQPLGAQLAGLALNAPAAITVSSDEHKKLRLSVREITPVESAPALVDVSDTDAFLDAVDDFLNRVEDDLAKTRPAGPVTYDARDSSTSRYFIIGEYIRRLERMIQRAEKWRDKGGNERQLYSLLTAGGKDEELFSPAAGLFTKLLDAGRQGRKLLLEWALRLEAGGPKVADYLQDIAREAALLQALAENQEAAGLILIQPLDQAGHKLAQNLATQYARLLEAEIGVELERLMPFDVNRLQFRPYAALAARSPHAVAMLRAEEGLHAGYDEKGLLSLLQVRVFPLAANADLAAALEKFTPPAAPELSPVLRFYTHSGGALDFRAGLMAAGNALHDGALRTFMLAGMRLPSELQT
jgi:DNA polymerase III delta prime subunit